MNEVAKRLMKLTKDEMVDSALRLGLEPLTRNAKKADWAEHIAKMFPEYSKNVILQMSEAEYLELSKLVLKNERITIGPASRNPMLKMALWRLERYGQAWRDTVEWHLTDLARKIMTPDHDLLEDLDFHDILYDEMQGWLIHTGMMPLNDLLDRVARISGQTEEMFEHTRERCMALLIGRDGMSCVYPDPEDGTVWIVYPDVEEPDRLIKRLKSPDVVKLDYPDFTTDELIRCQRLSGLPGRPDIYEPLRKWCFSRPDMTDDLFMDTVDEMVYLAENGDSNEALRCLMDMVEPRNERDFDAGMKAATKLLNSIPRWENKGHTAEELFVQRVGNGKAKMPGRNDPCPCGSGRKYKNCCGKRLN